MSLNELDAADSFLYGRAEFNKWVDEFKMRWEMPTTLMAMRAAINDAGLSGMLMNPQAIVMTEKLLNTLLGKE